jgi:hypothetical protein
LHLWSVASIEFAFNFETKFLPHATRNKQQQTATSNNKQQQATTSNNKQQQATTSQQAGISSNKVEANQEH